MHFLDINFIEIIKDRKFVWEWKICLNKKIEYDNDIKIDVNDKKQLIITPSDELLLEACIFYDKIRKGYICCDILAKNMDSNEIKFYKKVNEFISFIMKRFYDKYDKSLNKSILKIINPLDNNKIKTYIAKYKNTEHILTNFVNINTLEKEIIKELPLCIYIYPKLMFKSINIINKCIYIDIIITDAFIYKTKISRQIKFFNNENKGIMKLPNEIIINIMKILFKNDYDLKYLIFSCKKFFLLFINNYHFLHERWIFSDKSKFNTAEWKYQKIKSILNY